MIKVLIEHGKETMKRFFESKTKALAGFLVLATVSMPVAAVPISFSFEGVVTTVGSNLSSTFFVNDFVSGGFTFDSDAVNMGNSSFGRYAYTSFDWNIGTYAGSSTLIGANDGMGVYNDVS